MSVDWTRRSFLNTALVGVVSSPLVATIEAAPLTETLGEADRATLKAVADEIIPAGQGMPAASEVGAVAYIERLIGSEPGMGHILRESLAVLGTEQARADRLAALKSFETTSPASFTLLRDSVYEAYYTQPQVWKLIGYELHPTDHAGPQMKSFDESVIAVVGKKPRHYREV